MKYKINLDERVIYFSKILARWIEYHSNIKKISNKKLLWYSLKLVTVHDNWGQTKVFFPSHSKLNPTYQNISSLRPRLKLAKKTGIIHPYPRPRFFNISKSPKKFLNSIKTTWNIIKAIKNNLYRITSYKRISLLLNIPYLESYDDFIFSNIFENIRRNKDRRKLKAFLTDNVNDFDVNILLKIIPSCLVELLPIYKIIASKLSIKEIHSTVMDVHLSSTLMTYSFLNKDVKIIGYQHGGGYGFTSHEDMQAEYKFYNKFIYWGYNKNTIYPFRFENNKLNKSYNFQKINNFYKIYLFLDSCETNFFCTNFKDIEEMSSKLNLIGINLNIVLHPHDYLFSKKKLSKINKNNNLFISAKDISFDRSSIYLASIYSTLLWEIINQKLCFIVYSKNKIEYQSNYHFKLSKLMQKNELQYTFKNLKSKISKKLLNKIIDKNKNFYLDLYKL